MLAAAMGGLWQSPRMLCHWLVIAMLLCAFMIEQRLEKV